MTEMTLTDFDATGFHKPVAADADVEAIVVTRRDFAARSVNVALLQATATIEWPQVYTEIATIWKRLKDEIDWRRDYFRKDDGTGSSRIGRVYRVYTDWLALEHEAIDGLVAHAKHAANLLGAYDTEQRRIAEDTQRRLEAEAQATASADQLLAALDADADGATDIAAEILAEAPMAVHQSVAVQTPVVEGMSTTGRWKATLAVEGNIDKLILVAADEIRAKKARIAVSMLKADQTAINKAATALKGNLRIIAGTLGLHVFEDRTPRRS